MSNVHGSKWIRPEKRLAIYLRDEFHCVYCGADLHDATPAEVTLDHITPRCQGGSNEATNLVTACRSCNSRRQETALTEFADTDAQARIETLRALPLNLALAKALIAGRTGDAAVEE